MWMEIWVQNLTRQGLQISPCSFSPHKLHGFHSSPSGFLRLNRTEGGFYSDYLSPELEATGNGEDQGLQFVQ